MARAIRSCPIREFAGAVPGTSAASKAVILDENAKTSALDVTALKLNGTTLAATAAEIAMAADVSAFAAVYTVTSPAAIPATVRVIELNHITDVIAKTIASLVPYAGQVVFVKDSSASGTAAHTVTVTTGTWNGTNKIITLNAPLEAIAVLVDSAGNGTVLVNIGSVALSG